MTRRDLHSWNRMFKSIKFIKDTYKFDDYFTNLIIYGQTIWRNTANAGV